MKDNMKLMFAFVIAAFAVIACAFIISDADVISADGGGDTVVSPTEVGTEADFKTAMTNADVTSIKLTANITTSDDFNISGNRTLIVDLNNYTLTSLLSTDYAFVSVGKNVDDTDSSSVTFKSGNIVAEKKVYGNHAVLIAFNGSSMTLDNVNMKTTGTALLPYGNAAMVTVKNSTIDAGTYCVGTNAGNVKNGGIVINIESSKLTVNGWGKDSSGKWDGDDAAAYINVPGTMNIKGSELTGNRQVIFVRAGTAIVENTTINYIPTGKSSFYGMYESSEWKDGNEIPAGAIVLGNWSNGSAYDKDRSLTLDNVTVNVKDGTTTSRDINVIYEKVDRSGSNTDTVALTIKNSITFNTLNADGTTVNTNIKPKIVLSDVKMTLGGNVNFKVTDGSTLSDVVKAINGEATVTILNDMSVAESIELDGGKKITIDLNDKTISFAKDKNFKVYKATFILKGTGAVKEISPNYAPICMYGSTESTDSNYSVVTVGENVKLSGWAGVFISHKDSKNYGSVLNLNGTIEFQRDTSNSVGAGIYINGSIKEQTNCPIISISNTAKISGPGEAIYAAGYAKWTIDGATLEGTACAIEIRAGELTINGGTFTSTATEFSCNPNGNGSTTSGAAIAIAQHTTKKDISVTINGGTFKGVRALNESNPQNNDPAPKVTLSITNGIFDGGVETKDGVIVIKSGTTIFKGKVVADITLESGANLTLDENAVLTGTVKGPTTGSVENKLAANGLKAGAGGVTIVGGSISINGAILSEGTTEVAGATVTVSGDSVKISGSLDSGADMVIDGTTKVTLTENFTNSGTIEVKDNAQIVAESATSAVITNKGLLVDARSSGTDVPLDNSGSTGKLAVNDSGSSRYSSYTVGNKITYVTATITEIGDQTYSGSALKPAKVTFGSSTLTETTDYTVTYTNNTNAGTATVRVAPVVGSSYGFTAVEKTFTIKQIELTDISATVSPVIYSGTAQKPEPSVSTSMTIGSYKLLKNTDYTVTWSDNIAAGTDVGKAKISPVATSNYAFTAFTVNFTINKINPVAETHFDITVNGADYDGNTHAATVTLKSAFTGAGDITVWYTKTDGLATKDAPKDAGTYAVTFDVMEGTNFNAKSGLFAGTLTISKKTVTVTIGNITPLDYTGSEIKPTLNLAWTGVISVYTMTEGTDYDVTYSNNINAGTAAKVTVTAVSGSNYTFATVDKTFTINKIAPVAVNFSYAPSSVVYDGNVKEATVTLASGVTGMGTITVKYIKDGTLVDKADVKNAGMYKVLVSVVDGTNYTATTTDIELGTLTISQKSVKVQIGTIGNQIYDKGGVKPVLDVTTTTSDSLTLDKDYTVYYSNNIAVGNATAKVTWKEGSNYTFTSDSVLTAAFTIVPKSVEVTVSNIDGVIYSGSAYEPKPTVTADGVSLTLGIDYTLSYSNNTDAGTATVTVKPASGSNYTVVEKSVEFTISKKEITVTIKTIDAKTYNGAEIKPAPVLTVTDNIELTKGKDYTVSYVNNVNAGTATVKVTEMAGSNYTFKEATQKFEIGRMTIDVSINAIAPVEYTGSAIKPVPVLTVSSGVTLTEGKDYTVAYENNINAGTAAKVIVTSKGGSNYTFSKATAIFIITPKTSGTIVSDNDKFKFTSETVTTGDLNVVLKEDSRNYTVTFAAGTTIPAGTEVSVAFNSQTTDSTTYEIKTTDYTGSFTVKLPCQAKFSKANVICSNDPNVKVTNVSYDSKGGYVTFTASHNSLFTISLEKTSTVKVTDDGSSSSDSGDYGVMIAFLMLAAAIGFLAVIIKRS